MEELIFAGSLKRHGNSDRPARNIPKLVSVNRAIREEILHIPEGLSSICVWVSLQAFIYKVFLFPW